MLSEDVIFLEVEYVCLRLQLFSFFFGKLTIAQTEAELLLDEGDMNSFKQFSSNNAISTIKDWREPIRRVN